MPRKHGCLFLVYEHSGNMEEKRLSLPPSQYELMLFKHTFSKGFYSHHFFYCIFSPRHVCLWNIALGSVQVSNIPFYFELREERM